MGVVDQSILVKWFTGIRQIAETLHDVAMVTNDVGDLFLCQRITPRTNLALSKERDSAGLFFAESLFLFLPL